jgi:hypothetical protein
MADLNKAGPPTNSPTTGPGKTTSTPPVLFTFFMDKTDLDTVMRCPQCKVATQQTGWETGIYNKIEDQTVELRRYFVCTQCGNVSTKVAKVTDWEDKV